MEVEMTIEKKIKILLICLDMTQSELASKLGTTTSNLNQKIKRNSLTYTEIQKIAEVTNTSCEVNFVLPNGTKI
jgi:transcriptional regulator with XRE-family HTH domain